MPRTDRPQQSRLSVSAASSALRASLRKVGDGLDEGVRLCRSERGKGLAAAFNAGCIGRRNARLAKLLGRQWQLQSKFWLSGPKRPALIPARTFSIGAGELPINVRRETAVDAIGRMFVRRTQDVDERLNKARLIRAQRFVGCW